MPLKNKVAIKKCCDLKKEYLSSGTCVDMKKEFKPPVYGAINKQTKDLVMMKGFDFMQNFDVTIKMEDCSQLIGSYVIVQSRRNKVKLIMVRYILLIFGILILYTTKVDIQ